MNTASSVLSRLTQEQLLQAITGDPLAFLDYLGRVNYARFLTQHVKVGRSLFEKFQDPQQRMSMEEYQELFNALVNSENRFFYNKNGDKVNLEEYLREAYTHVDADLRVEEVTLGQISLEYRAAVIQELLSYQLDSKVPPEIRQRLNQIVDNIIEGTVPFQEALDYNPEFAIFLNNVAPLLRDNQPVAHVRVRNQRTGISTDIPILAGQIRSNHVGFQNEIRVGGKVVGQMITISTNIPPGDFKQVVGTIVHEVDHGVMATTRPAPFEFTVLQMRNSEAQMDAFRADRQRAFEQWDDIQTRLEQTTDPTLRQQLQTQLQAAEDRMESAYQQYLQAQARYNQLNARLAALRDNRNQLAKTQLLVIEGMAEYARTEFERTQQRGAEQDGVPLEQTPLFDLSEAIDTIARQNRIARQNLH